MNYPFRNDHKVAGTFFSIQEAIEVRWNSRGAGMAQRMVREAMKDCPMKPINEIIYGGVAIR